MAARFIILVVYFFTVAKTDGQTLLKTSLTSTEESNLKKLLTQSIHDTIKLDALIKLTAYHLYHIDGWSMDTSHLREASIYLRQAKEMNARLFTDVQIGLMSLYESTLARKTGNKNVGKALADNAVRQLRSLHDDSGLALAYLELSRYHNSHEPRESALIISLYNTLFDQVTARARNERLKELLFEIATYYHVSMKNDSNPVKLAFLNHLVQAYKIANDRLNEFWARKEVADIKYQQGKLNEAIRELLDIAREQREGNYERICWTYDLLSGLYAVDGNYEKALFYSLETIKNVKTALDSVGLTVFYARIAGHYSATGSIAEAVDWNLRRLNYLIQKKDTRGCYTIIHNIASDLIILGRRKEALALVLEKSKIIKPVGNTDTFHMLLALARAYSALNNNVMAEKYCEDLITLRNRVHTLTEINAPLLDQFLASFYLKIGKYHKAEIFIKPFVTKNPIPLSGIEFLFKLDSAKGNYLSAIQHLQAFHRAKDSVFGETKSKQIEQLKISYATQQKDSLINLKEQNIQLLTRQDQLQKSKLKQQSVLRNISLTIAALLIIIVALLYNRYRLKQRTNLKLELQQREISNKNKVLQHLLSEKEWLLKEIHHRVKNNLQIVMSLLNSQSAYIDNEVALNAIHDSQHRVHAMSLIHQKLYNSESVSSIDMAFYIRELTSYLNDSFNTSKRIRFELNIEPIKMDVSQAVPIGLILNEAITNSLKYAFPGGQNGVITVSLTTDSGSYLLIIADNGIGLPHSYKTKKKPTTLGISLMEGLTEDLDGHFSIENNNGTVIKVLFVHDPEIKRNEFLSSQIVSNN
jgi:two-component system, sensor histidine kinase PdtaS